MRKLHTESSIAGLVQVFDIDETDDNKPFFVMTYADRGTLQQRHNAKPLPMNEVASVITFLNETLTALHNAGVVHRDIKPSNVLIRSDQRANTNNADAFEADNARLVLGDLGLAKDLTSNETGFSAVSGTENYAAPEQLDPTKTVDQRADIYSATRLVEHLIGNRAELSPGLASALKKGSASDVTDRYQAIEDWGRELLKCKDFYGPNLTSADSPASNAPPAVTQTRSSNLKRHRIGRRTWWGAAAIAVLLTAAAGWFILDNSNATSDGVAADQSVTSTLGPENSDGKPANIRPALMGSLEGTKIEIEKSETIAVDPRQYLSGEANPDTAENSKLLIWLKLEGSSGFFSREGMQLKSPDGTLTPVSQLLNIDGKAILFFGLTQPVTKIVLVSKPTKHQTN